MIERCENPKHVHYHRYGGRGIQVCKRWRTFENFLTDLGPRPQHHTLGRSDWSLQQAFSEPATKWNQKMTKPSKELMQKIGRSNVRRSKAHERRIANLLTKWSGEEFRRRRVEGRESNVIDRESTADVIPASKRIIFSIEAKCGDYGSIDGILANPHTNKWVSWWHQSCFDAILLSKALNTQIWPMMFFKPHPNFDWVAIAQEPFKLGILQPKTPNSQRPIWFNNMAFDMFHWLGPIEHNISRSKKNPVLESIKLHSCYIVRWQDLADNIDPKSIFIPSQ